MATLVDGKVVVVTGASQGLGRAIAIEFGKAGASVLLVARREEELDDAAAEVRQHGAQAAICVADVSQPADAPKVVEAAVEAFGGIDALVNCAGVFVWKRFLDLEPEDWNRTISTNLSGPFYLTQMVARRLVDQNRGGAVVNIASIHGTVGDASVVPHCASKFGLIGLTKASAEALREYGVRVYAISPGQIESDPSELVGKSPNHKVTRMDIASLAIYLCSDLARTMSGAVIDTFGSTRTEIRG